VTVQVSAEGGSRVDLFASSRPSTTYQLVRSAVVGAGGTTTWQLSPSTATRFYATATGPSGRSVASTSAAVSVAARVSLAGSRTGRLAYRFSGAVVPGRPGVLVALHQRTAGGSLVPLGSTRTTAGGRWSLPRRFARPGTVTVVARTGADALNAAGTSTARRLTLR
jgi:hypothetical protein